MRYYLIVILICFYFLFNHWQGDPTIYHVFAKNISEGNGLSFNGFSTGATSPLWAFILSLSYIFSNPIIASKFIGLVFLIGTVLFYNKLFREDFVATGVLIYFITKPSLFLYETSLFFLILGLGIYGIIKKKELLILLSVILLPFTRPESIILILGYVIYSKNYKVLTGLIPYLLYVLYAYLTIGHLTSIESRLGMTDWYLIRRYSLVFLTPVLFISLKFFSKHVGYYVFVGVLMGLLIQDCIKDNGLSFDYVTMKGLDLKGKVLTNEVQIKYWTDAEVISMDGVTDEKILECKSLNELIKKERPDYIIDVPEQGYNYDLSNYKFLRKVEWSADASVYKRD